MKAATALSNLFRLLAAAAFVLLFATSCQKERDDNACPHDTTTNQGTTRDLMDTGNGRIAPDPTSDPVGGQLRSGEVFNPGNGDDGGISDDGDDEADKESSNKPRPGQ